MITTKDNLFHVLAAEVAKSDRAELYLVAGAKFEVLSTSPEVRRVLDIATSVAQCSNASDALALHYNACVGAQTSHPSFCDDCGGFITTDRISVQFEIQKISDMPDIFRVLFARVDAGKLAVDMKAHLKKSGTTHRAA